MGSETPVLPRSQQHPMWPRNHESSHPLPAASAEARLEPWPTAAAQTPPRPRKTLPSPWVPGLAPEGPGCVDGVGEGYSHRASVVPRSPCSPAPGFLCQAWKKKKKIVPVSKRLRWPEMLVSCFPGDRLRGHMVVQWGKAAEAPAHTQLLFCSATASPAQAVLRLGQRALFYLRRWVLFYLWVLNEETGEQRIEVTCSRSHS